MSNTSKGWGDKGSKFWMQVVVHIPKLQKELNAKIGDESIRWLSPLAGDNETFDEYKLNQKKLPKELAFEKPVDFYGFWPKGQPQWDGIAVSGDGKTLYLVEAKAHLEELNSKLSSSNPESTQKIQSTLDYVYKKYFAPGGTQSKWEVGFYQLANRLSFLKMLQEKLPFGTFEEVKLVLLNFVNDITYRETKLEKWEEHYECVWNQMIGKKEAPEDVIMVFFDVKGRGITKHPTQEGPLVRG